MAEMVQSSIDGRGSDAIHMKTLRGKKQLVQPCTFHASFQPKPWLPLRENVEWMLQSYEGEDAFCYMDRNSQKVYDIKFTQEIGHIHEGKMVWKGRLSRSILFPDESDDENNEQIH